jgi:hypothetical protein
VRLHHVDENVVAEIAPILAYLRSLQRHFKTAVLLVHHSRKGAAHLRAGQALRGSSELHAWGDSYLYLRRQGKRLVLSAEHRSAKGTDDLALELHADADVLALRVVSHDEMPPAPSEPLLSDTILQLLASSTRPVSVRQLRAHCGVRTATLCDTLAALLRANRISKSTLGYQLVRN